MNRYFRGIPLFLWRYPFTRSWLSLVAAIPAIVFTATILIVFLRSRSEQHRAELRTKYETLATEAIEREDLAASELYLTRALTMSPDPAATSFQFAKRLFDQAGANRSVAADLLTVTGIPTPECDPQSRRALMLMQSLAPRRRDADGYADAHRFMAEYWRTRTTQSPATHALAMQYEVFADPANADRALQFARFLAGYNRHREVIELLSPLKNDNADVLMQLAASHSKAGDPKSASTCMAGATELLRQQLTESPGSVETRLQLSRVIAAQGKLLQSMFVLAEGYNASTPPELVDNLIQRYTVWLSMMTADTARSQLEQIDLALRFSPDNPEPNTNANPEINGDGELTPNSRNAPDAITLSTGERVPLPGPIVRFHAALLNNSDSFLIPLLLGTEQAGQYQFESAIALLEQSYEAAPKHPVVANNLAWTIAQRFAGSTGNVRPLASAVSEQPSIEDTDDDPAIIDPSSNTAAESLSEPTDEVITAELARAWELADIAVAACPENVSFRETRGTIAAYTNRWQEAANDLQFCADSGSMTPHVLRLLAASVEKIAPAATVAP